MIDTGAIVSFRLNLNLGLRHGELLPKRFLVHTQADGTPDEAALAKQIQDIPEVSGGLKTTRDSFLFQGRVADLTRYLQLEQFFLNLDGFSQVEMDVLDFLSVPGVVAYSRYAPELTVPQMCYKHTFTKPQLQVIRWLKDNPRMPIKELASNTGLTVKRVRKIIKTFQQTQCIIFSCNYHLSAVKQTGGFIRILIDAAQTTPEDFARWVFTSYPFECWAIRPVTAQSHRIWLQISVHSVHVIDEMVKTIKSKPFVTEADAIIFYHHLPKSDPYADPSQRFLDKLLAEADL
jgi:hypothetical protein